MTSAAPSARNQGTQTIQLRVWQWSTVALMVTGYAGYYLCRSDFAVALPLRPSSAGHHRQRERYLPSLVT
jgi:sugar phosphate permease